MNIFSIQLPSKLDTNQGNQPLSPSVLMSNKKIRDGSSKNDNEVFLTQLNSSSVYALGVKQGESQVSLLIAIEYPEKYGNEKN
jgi:hypothetical protein